MIPLIFSGETEKHSKEIVLAGDLGGTKMNLALYEVQGNSMKVITAQQYHPKDYASLDDIIKTFLATLPQKPESICIGVAGPVINNTAEIVNLSWMADGAEIKAFTGLTEVLLINDLEATAYGLACLEDSDMIVIQQGKFIAGNIAIVAPGTGLGEAGLYWDGKVYHPFATEGGHADFTPRTDTDIALLKFLQQSHNNAVSCEHLISGPGIFNIYTFLRDVQKMEEPAALTEEMKLEDDSAVISKAAIDHKIPICIETMQLFIKYLARECANMVLKMKATGGLYLGGGIPPKIAPLLKTDFFIQQYLDCDRMQDLIKAVPIKIIKNDKAALMGAAYYAAYAM